MSTTKSIVRKTTARVSKSSTGFTAEEIDGLVRFAKSFTQIDVSPTNVDASVHHTLLVELNGERIAIPVSVAADIRKVVQKHLRERRGTIAIVDDYVSTIDAARILNVSRPYLIKVLEQGEIPFHKVGSHRRIPYAALMQYKQNRDKHQQEALKRLAAMSDELDFSLEEIEQFNKDRRPGHK